jgi:hypothetical protein
VHLFRPSLGFLVEAEPRLNNRQGQKVLFVRGAHNVFRVCSGKNFENSLFNEFVFKLGPRVPKNVEFIHERVEYNVFCSTSPLKAPKRLKCLKISLTFRFDKLCYLSKSVHTGENSQILTVSNKK